MVKTPSKKGPVKWTKPTSRISPLQPTNLQALVVRILVDKKFRDKIKAAVKSASNTNPDPLIEILEEYHYTFCLTTANKTKLALKLLKIDWDDIENVTILEISDKILRPLGIDPYSKSVVIDIWLLDSP